MTLHYKVKTLQCQGMRRPLRVKLILPALTEATSPFWRPIKYSLFPPLGLATLAGFLEPDELGVAVRQACPGLASLVEQRMHVRKARVARGSRPLTPGKRDAAHLLVAQVGEGANVARRRDHDFVMFEDRVEIRDDSDGPARCIRLPAARAM